MSRKFSVNIYKPSAERKEIGMLYQLNFHKIHKKTPVPESFLIKLRATYFYGTPQVAASENIKLNR